MYLLAFFDEFTFETLLSIISCIVGIVALFVGGRALHINNKSHVEQNEKKKFGKNSKDESQHAGRDMYNNFIFCLGEKCPKKSDNSADEENSKN